MPHNVDGASFSIYFEAINYKTTELSTQLESFSPNNKKWSRFMFHSIQNRWNNEPRSKFDSFRSDERGKRKRKRRLEIKRSSLHLTNEIGKLILCPDIVTISYSKFLDAAESTLHHIRLNIINQSAMCQYIFTLLHTLEESQLTTSPVEIYR
jgi:hypothetical protein